MKRSPLHDIHQSLGARFVDFGGWEMPVQYQSVLAEHRAVRHGAGWFDVSHLGRFELTGPGAEEALLALLSNDISLIEPGRTQYTLMLNEKGGIVDDLVVWWWGPDEYWVFPNAANHEQVLARFSQMPGCETRDLRDDTVLIAVQGPAAPKVLEDALGTAPGRFRTSKAQLADDPVMMAGTGYTGERGGEICTDPDTGRHLMAKLADAGVTPCGLAARDTLRLEAGLPLWGADLDETITPFEAALDFAVAMDHEFVGRDGLQDQLDSGPGRLLVGFILEEKGIPRHGYRVRTDNGEGVVTSGNLSPMLDTGVGLALVTPAHDPGQGRIEVEIRNRWVAGSITKPPFHKR